MNPDQYQQLAIRTERTPDFVHPKSTAIGQERLARLIHAALGACTEVGELQDMIKKHLIYGKDFDPINVIEECGDVLWYLALALDACGFKLSDCMERNISKLRVRFPDKFTEGNALKRDLERERAALGVEHAQTNAGRLLPVAGELLSMIGKILAEDDTSDEAISRATATIAFALAAAEVRGMGLAK